MQDTVVGVGVGVGLGVGVAVGSGVFVGVGELVTVGDELAVDVAVAVDATVDVAVTCWVGVLVGTDVPVPVGTGVLVETAVAVPAVVTVAVGVTDPEGPVVEQGTGVGVGVGWAETPGALSALIFIAYALNGRTVRPTVGAGVGVVQPAAAMPSFDDSMVIVATDITMPATAMPRVKYLVKQASF